jgi:hypothetical protein
MGQTAQFRKILPVSQVVLAAFLGGWGEWLRYSALNHRFFGGTLWDSTARFHVWPWPLKFTFVLNLPALLGGAIVGAVLSISWILLSAPLHVAGLPAVPEWISSTTILPFVALFWYWIGFHMDRNTVGDASGKIAKWQWVALLIFTSGCVFASTVPSPLGGYTSFLVFGALLWLFAALAALGLLAFRAKKSKARASS